MNNKCLLKKLGIFNSIQMEKFHVHDSRWNMHTAIRVHLMWCFDKSTQISSEQMFKEVSTFQTNFFIFCFIVFFLNKLFFHLFRVKF